MKPFFFPGLYLSIIMSVLCSSCQSSTDILPLSIIHKLSNDSLKVLTKGSPPFVLELQSKDSLLITKTMDRIGIIKIPLPSTKSRAGNYIVTVTSHYQDTTFSFYLKEKQAVKKTKERPKTQTSSKKRHTKNKTVTRQHSRTTSKKKRKSIHGKWSEWARHDCFQYIWYRYRV